MKSVIEQVADRQKKKAVVEVRSGDSVRVHQKVIEGGKERVQIFEGSVIRVSRSASLSATFAVRRIASGVGVEKTFLIHSPSILKVEVTKRSRVRRNRLNYMRSLRGKSSRLSGIEFDKEAVNAVHDESAEAEEAKLRDESESRHEAAQAEKAQKESETEAKVEKSLADREPEADKHETKPTKKADSNSPSEEPNQQ